MRRRAKPAKAQGVAKPVARRSPQDWRDLEKRLAEALEQQTATAEILRVISSSPTDVQPVFDEIVRSAQRLLKGFSANLMTLRDRTLHLSAWTSTSPEGDEALRRLFPHSLDSSDSLVAQGIRDVIPVAVSDIETDPRIHPAALATARARGYRSILWVPLVRDAAAIGIIGVTRREPGPFSENVVAVLKAFADQAVIAIENVRLFTELEKKNRALTESHAQVTEALEQQTATAEILRVISMSPTNLQPVLDAVVKSAARFCAAPDASIFRLDGDNLRADAHHGPVSQPVGFLVPVVRGSVAGRSVLERQAIGVTDLQVETDEFPEGSFLARQTGQRATLSAPLLREGAPIGAILLRRAEAVPFTGKQIELVQTFAHQAVIAIENVRLFTELQASNRELTTALDTQTATSDILRVISRSQTDVQPVFQAIVDSAARLLSAYSGSLTRVVEDHLVLAAFTAVETGAHVLTTTFPQSLAVEGSHTRTIRDRVPFNVADAEADPRTTERGRQIALARGYRSQVVVPMLRRDEAIGTISLTRREPGGFTTDEIALLQTFADQAVIAIENARLLNELQTRTRELEVASQHKSEFLASMSHELRTPLNAVIGFSDVLLQGMFGETNEKQSEYLRDILASGQHLLSLINDILDLSKIEAGRMDLDLDDFHLPSAIDDALLLMRERAARRSLALERHVDRRLGEIRADQRKIKQVLLNVLSNAVKFTPEGGRIDVRAALVDGAVEIAVADTGIGIAQEDHEVVFEEFKQVGKSDKKAEGTGLGLALCRKFVELHGGRIWVESQEGIGSTFIFTLPLSIEQQRHPGR